MLPTAKTVPRLWLGICAVMGSGLDSVFARSGSWVSGSFDGSLLEGVGFFIFISNISWLFRSSTCFLSSCMLLASDLAWVSSQSHTLCARNTAFCFVMPRCHHRLFNLGYICFVVQCSFCIAHPVAPGNPCSVIWWNTKDIKKVNVNLMIADTYCMWNLESWETWK